MGLKSSNIKMHHTEASKAGGRPCVGLLRVLPLSELSPEHWHLVQLPLIGTWAALLFSNPLKNTLPLQANAVAMQRNREAQHQGSSYREQNLTFANMGMFTWTSGSKEKRFCLPSFLLSLFS